MASAIRAASRAGRTSWTRTMWAPLRMVAVVAAREALARAETGASDPLCRPARGRPRKDLRETPARMGRSSERSSCWRVIRVKFSPKDLPKP